MCNDAESPGRINQLPIPIVHNIPDSQFLQSEFLSEVPISNLVKLSECTDKSVSTTSQMRISEKSNVDLTNMKTPGTLVCVAPCVSVRDDERGLVESAMDRTASLTDSSENLHKMQIRQCTK